MRLPTSLASAGELLLHRVQVVKPLGSPAHVSHQRVAEEGSEWRSELLGALSDRRAGQPELASEFPGVATLSQERQQLLVLAVLRGGEVLSVESPGSLGRRVFVVAAHQLADLDCFVRLAAHQRFLVDRADLAPSV